MLFIFWMRAIAQSYCLYYIKHENQLILNQTAYKCPKCGNQNYESDEFQATGGIFSKIFNDQNKKFTTVSCTRCTYIEIYKAGSSQLGNISDFFMNYLVNFYFRILIYILIRRF